MMKVGLVCLRGAINRASWRGNADAIAAALERNGVTVVRFDIERERLSLLYKAKQFALQNVLKGGYTRHREPSMLRHYSRLVDEAAEAAGVDVLLALTPMAVAYTSGRVPVVFWNDSPFAGMLDWYPEFSRLGRKSVAHGHDMEVRAHAGAALAVYSSQWAADIAVREYGADPARVKVVDFGANLNVTWDRSYVLERIEERLTPPFRLAWVGVHWQRKGGDIALAVAGHLHAAGVPVELAIAGVEPPAGVRGLPYVNVMGFLATAEVTRLLDSATVLLLPSRADLSPIVFSEACSLGVPVISTPIGGIPAIVEDGRNGKLFDLTTPPADIATYIRRILGDPATYRDLAANARDAYETRLNWDVAIRRMIGLMRSVTAQSPYDAPDEFVASRESSAVRSAHVD